ncbi:MAG TPA: isoleucine--tRNA ligase [Thermomicrobiales bacterium]|nr:isoleucine--tRNA ligase [Thermomicrobiales bacterium]
MAENVATTAEPLFAEAPAKVDFPARERALLRHWAEQNTVEQYLRRNDDSPRRYSFLDGPITANGMMGVHHAWGRTYKDLYQRYHTMLGERQRYQNGFDCQGLWVEVGVEKDLGLGSKRDIERYGIAAFVQKCKERVWKYADLQTKASQRLGYWMDWDHSYYTMSDENNYTIWYFLKTCHERGWIYKGHDVMPWCPRCGTGLSEHEIVTEGYQERTHTSLYVRFPVTTPGHEGEYLLVWTTTPWTLTSNVAAAVHPDLTYLKVRQGDAVYYLAQGAVATALQGTYETLAELPGCDLLDLTYRGPYDELPAEAGVAHRVIAWDDVSAEEGTGIVHIAPGCGKEDFALSKEYDLAVVAPIDEFGVFLPGFDWLTGRYVGDVPLAIAEDLERKGLLYRLEPCSHRYPTCWRCDTDLVFRLVDEWYIAMDALREPMMRVVDRIRWLPSFGRERELDWLRNMDDWMISKKRYWGLALPIYECPQCGHFEVIGSETELQERAVEGWDEFAGHTPHRPWIDAVKIACANCGAVVPRIADVGNPWLDAGIVAFSTLDYRHNRAYWEEWFPADFITESFPGQFRNWFYSLLAQSTALVDRPPFKTVLGYGLLRDETGREMHKSWGNAIEFEEGAETMGVDVMRWLFMASNPSVNLNFGYNLGDEVRRRFILPLWNSHSFWTTYARLDGFDPRAHHVPVAERAPLDRWVLARLNETVRVMRDRLDDYDAQGATKAAESFVVDDLSNWYIRRSRPRFWRSSKEGRDPDKTAAQSTLYEVLLTLAKALAPLIPFVTEEMYLNLARGAADAPASVHLCDYPAYDEALARDTADLVRDMAAVVRVVELGRAARTEAGVRVRQPLPRILVHAPSEAEFAALMRHREQILDELNVKEVAPMARPEDYIAYEIRPNLPLIGKKYGKRVPAVRSALAAADAGELARRVAAGQGVTLTLDDGEAVTLAPEEVLVDTRQRGGFAVAEDAGYVVALDTTLTPELVREGLARDFVRVVQEARKNAGLEIADRVRVNYAVPADAEPAVAAFADFIKAETLALDLAPGDLDASAYQETFKHALGGEPVTVGVTRVG